MPAAIGPADRDRRGPVKPQRKVTEAHFEQCGISRVAKQCVRPACRMVVCRATDADPEVLPSGSATVLYQGHGACTFNSNCCE
ncbi:hypothetical protein MNKW57_10800 [Biformimicrobium ophioploci]|uniref:Uncharacterized protein n=1 Tax=Biformimicrobium ophioploci TaxID=3036711 RepID=A0ABQ6LXB6_9GAMM|nr:hypothetical protein MNKW57_10800 [Microbulbifer sp. NKW57]